MTKVLCTGTAGFIGSNLAAACLRMGWEVDGVDDLSNGHLEFVPEGVNQITGDFSGHEVLKRVVNGSYDYVFHLAAVPRVQLSVEQPYLTNDINVTKTLALMDACVGNVKKFVFASSCSVYGNARTIPTPEHSPKSPRSPYALQKLTIEEYLKFYSEFQGLSSTSLRFFNVFGPNQLGDSPYATAVASWLNNIFKGRPMRSDGDGTQTRDMVHVDNVVHACILAAKHQTEREALQFNVGTGDCVSNNQIIDYLLKRYPNAEVYSAPWRPGDVKDTRADLTYIRSVLKYEPVVSFWDGLDSTIDWIEKNKELFMLGLTK